MKRQVIIDIDEGINPEITVEIVAQKIKEGNTSGINPTFKIHEVDEKCV